MKDDMFLCADLMGKIAKVPPGDVRVGQFRLAFLACSDARKGLVSRHNEPFRS